MMFFIFMVGGFAGFCMCAIFSGQAYEKGYRDGRRMGKWCD